MNLLSFYSVLLTEDLAQLSEFYQKQFEMESNFSSDWYVSLTRKGIEGTFQLAILKSDHPTVPTGFREESRGIILNFEVENVREIYSQLIEVNKLPVHLDIRDEPWGQRHFITSDPDNNLLDIIEPIQPSEEFLAQYSKDTE